jgi:hypothetical protein
LVFVRALTSTLISFDSQLAKNFIKYCIEIMGEVLSYIKALPIKLRSSQTSSSSRHPSATEPPSKLASWSVLALPHVISRPLERARLPDHPRKQQKPAREMGRAPCCDKETVKKGPWSAEEDAVLKAYIEEHGTGGNWIQLPHKIGTSLISP